MARKRADGHAEGDGQNDQHVQAVRFHGDSFARCTDIIARQQHAFMTNQAEPDPGPRVVHDGKIVTAAGISAGIDLALWLAGELVIEYDSQPPFDAGHKTKASKAVQLLAATMLDDRMPSDQKRLVPKAAWRRFVDLVRTGR